jgi:HK97 gp10 family phage protein
VSVEMQFDVSGVLELEQKLARLDQSLVARVDRALDFEVQSMQKTAESLAPRRTGRLARSIVARRLREWSFQLVALASYAVYVEFGTRFMAARRFLSRAIELCTSNILNHVNQAIREAVQESGSR